MKTAIINTCTLTALIWSHGINATLSKTNMHCVDLRHLLSLKHSSSVLYSYTDCKYLNWHSLHIQNKCLSLYIHTLNAISTKTYPMYKLNAITSNPSPHQNMAITVGHIKTITPPHKSKCLVVVSFSYSGNTTH